MSRVVAYLAAVVVVCGLAAGAVVLLAGGRGTGSGSTATSAVRSELVPGPGQTFLTGDLSKLSIEKAQSPPIPAPFTISAVERGVGRATIANALVDGKRTSISWSGGTPLPISGAGAIDLGGARVEVDGSGVTWKLDGAARPIAPGAYRVGAPVAVGEEGLAQSRDGVSFTADTETVLSSHGDVVLRLPLRPVEFDGPGVLGATGRLRVQSPTAVTEVGYVVMNEAPFHVRVAPTGSQIVVTAVLQGPITTGR